MPTGPAVPDGLLRIEVGPHRLGFMVGHGAAMEELMDNPELAEVGRARKLAAPLVAGAAAWLARQTLDSVYRRATGTAAPNWKDSNVPFRKIVIWAGATAAAVAAVNVVVDRTMLRPKGPPHPVAAA
jgi:Protein of unknown function (DUF4235)